MKKKSLSLFIYVMVVFTVIILLLIFNNKNDGKGDNLSDKDTEVSMDNVSDNSTDTENNNEQNTEIFATELILNIPENIEILVNTKVCLLEGFAIVKPAEAKNKISLNISSYYTEDINGLKLEDLTLTALKVDTYKLVITVPKKAGVISKSVYVTVHENNTKSHIIQNINEIYVGDNYDILSCFSFNTTHTYELKTDSLLNCKNDKIYPATAGESKLEFLFTKDYLKYVYNFNIIVKNQPIYKIVLTDIQNNHLDLNISSGFAYIYFNIKNRHEENVNQPIDVIVENNKVLKVLSKDIPLIEIELLEVGETLLTISLQNDKSIFITISIAVK